VFVFSKNYWSAFGLFVYLGFSSNLVQAQTTFSIGPQLGLSTSTAHFADSPTYITTFSPSYRLGFEAGLVGSLAGKHLTLQAALLFSQKGYEVKEAPVPTTNGPGVYNGQYRFKYLILPLNVAYTTSANGQGLRVFAGLYVGVLVGGNYSSVYSLNGLPPIEGAGKIRSGDKTAAIGSQDIYSKNVDAGLQAGVGYGYQNLLLQVSYSLGIRNLATSFETGSPRYPIAEGTPYYNRAFQASLAYLFNMHQ
jgi:hypothetical protein